MPRPRRPSHCLIGNLLLIASGCVGAAEEPSAPRSLPFDDVFNVEAVIRLEEAEDDSIAGMGGLIETRSGGLLMFDRLLPRARAYRPDGTLFASFGKFGQGPREFKGISGLAEDDSGHVLVLDQQLLRISVLTADLEFDTLMSTFGEYLSGPIAALPSGGFVIGIVLGRGGYRFHKMSPTGSFGWSIFPPPDATLKNPYWGSIATLSMDVADGRIFAATALMYPIAVYGVDGDSIGVIGSPPPSFRQVPVVEPGAFGGPGANRALEAWLDAFTIMTDISVVRNRFLVVTHARLARGPTFGFEERPYAIDVYDLRTDRKILEDIALPSGSRVLAGGEYLYLLTTGGPPDPWVIHRLSFSLGGLQ